MALYETNQSLPGEPLLRSRLLGDGLLYLALHFFLLHVAPDGVGTKHASATRVSLFPQDSLPDSRNAIRSNDCHCQKPHSKDMDTQSGSIDAWRLCALTDKERLCESSGNKFLKGVIQIMQRKPCKLVVVFLQEFSQLLRAKLKEKEIEY